MTPTVPDVGSRLRAYMVYDRCVGSEEGAVLVFAPTAREARAEGFGTMQAYYDCLWIDCATRWLKSGANAHRIAEKEAAALPYTVEPDACEVCEQWDDGGLNEKGRCESCAELDAFYYGEGVPAGAAQGGEQP